MLFFFSIVLIILILFFLVIYKRKYILNALNKNNLDSIRTIHNQKKKITSSAENNTFYYQNYPNYYSEFYKIKLRRKMFKLSKGTPEDRLKAIKIAEVLADKSTLPLLRKGLKDMNQEIVELSATLIRKFK